MPDKYSRVRISDIAERAGVSAGTVDRVIHNRGEVARNTRDKVLEILNEMNYEPDILASTLASRKNFRFASLIPESGKDNPFWAMPAAGLNKALEQVKHFGVIHQMFYFDYFDRESFKRASKKVFESKPDGLIIAPVFSDLAEDLIEQCNECHIPAVFINEDTTRLPKLSFIGQDSYRSGMVAARLLDYGLPDDASIWVINIMSEKGTNKHLLSREEGFRAYFTANSLADRHLQAINIFGSDDNAVSEALGNKLCAGKDNLSMHGIFVTNSRVYMVARCIKKSGISSVRLIGYDLLEENVGYLKNGTIDFLIGQKPAEQGYKSFMTLFDHIIMKKATQAYQYLPIDIITRENIDYYLNE